VTCKTNLVKSHFFCEPRFFTNHTRRPQFWRKKGIAKTCFRSHFVPGRYSCSLSVEGACQRARLPAPPTTLLLPPVILRDLPVSPRFTPTFSYRDAIQVQLLTSYYILFKPFVTLCLLTNRKEVFLP